MKKFIVMMLILTMAVAMTACGRDKAPATEDKAPLAGTMEENVLKVMEIAPVEFMGGILPVDLGDTSEEGKWAVTYYTGLSDASQIADVAVYESMMGSQAFSLVMVRTAEGTDPQTVAQQMKEGIDPRKWICVGADQIMAAGYGDTVMFIMVDSQLGLNAQSYVDAFKQVCGAELDFTI